MSGKEKLNLILRGHVRNGFDDARLYEFVQFLDGLFDLEIYIHTWSVKQNSVSHRKTAQDDTPVTNAHFANYFKELSARIVHLAIEDDRDVLLIGRVDGPMFPGAVNTPIVGWKRMIYGKFKMSRLLKRTKADPRERVLDTRLDLFFVHDLLPHRDLKSATYNFVSHHASLPKVKNVFWLDDSAYGVDNLYFGSVDSVHELHRAFHYELDTIIARHARGPAAHRNCPELLYARESREIHKRKLAQFAAGIPNVSTSPLRFVFEVLKLQHDPSTLWLEFGTATGSTINYISGFTPHAVFGFDSFEGLPEAWREGFPKGAFNRNGSLPPVRENVSLVKGWFSDTLAPFLAANPGPVSFVHIDCDIYSSTRCVLETLRERMADDCIIVFDELVNYEGFDEDSGELHAFFEFVTTHNISFEWLGMNGTPRNQHENVAVRLRAAPPGLD